MIEEFNAMCDKYGVSQEVREKMIVYKKSDVYDKQNMYDFFIMTKKV